MNKYYFEDWIFVKEYTLKYYYLECSFVKITMYDSIDCIFSDIVFHNSEKWDNLFTEHISFEEAKKFAINCLKQNGYKSIDKKLKILD